MLSIQVCNIYDWAKPVHTFSPDEVRAVFCVKDSLKMQNNNAYEIGGVLYPAMVDLWELLFKQKKYGILLDFGWIKLPFYKYYVETQNVSGKGVKLRYRSSIFMLSEAFQIYAPGLYSGSFYTFVSTLLGTNYSPVFHTPDFTIQYEIKDKTNYEIFKEVCENYLVSFRENGISNVSGLPEIAIGKGSDFPISLTDKRYRLLKWDSRELSLDNEVYIKQVNQNFNNEGYTHVSPYIDNGVGTGVQLGLTASNYTWIYEDFPVVSLTSDNKTRFWVVHQKQLNDSGVTKAKVLPINLSPSITDAVRGVNTTPEGVQKNMYLQTVSFLRQNSNVDNYGVEAEYNDLVLPLTKLQLYYEEKVKNTLGVELQTMLVNGSFIRKEITYNGEQLAAMM